MSHPSRSTWRSDLPRPSPADVRQARGHLTQDAAAALAGYAGREKWARLESGEARPSAQAWELYLLRTGQHPEFKMVARRGQPDNQRK